MFVKRAQAMGHDSQPIKMAANGRLSIPAKQRRALGLEKGGMVVSTLENGELRIRPIAVVLAEVQAMVARFTKESGDTVDQFIADRRAEAAREEQEMQAYEERAQDRR
jgi:bifunctional DNA-binding transcriptional regulator/antitoxin component of YhaV-PrlF toxin-antitoxin module